VATIGEASRIPGCRGRVGVAIVGGLYRVGCLLLVLGACAGSKLESPALSRYGLKGRGDFVADGGTVVATNGVDGKVPGLSWRVGVAIVDGLY
jgi:hypothetical protein